MEIIIIILYIMSCVVSYGMSTANWYWYYEQRIRKDRSYPYYNNHVSITPDVIAYTISGPIRILCGILIREANCPYWIKWSYKSLKDI